MYEEYFGLSRPPFRITPDTSLFYDGGKRGDILGALVYAVQRGEGIVKVVGEVGSGKTMLCRMLQLKLPKSVEIIYIANPSVSAQDILFVIAHELGLSMNKGVSKHEVMHLLQDYLLQRHMEDKQVVLFIEEAQGMPLDTLEEIRLLSNLETDQNKLLQIILFGQPELDDNLSHQSIRQLRERITHNFNLTPLTPEEIHNYLNFRMREVGYTGPELIDLALARKVAKYSNGLLRRINIIADKILLSAFAEGTHNLTSKHVIAAVNDSSFNQEPSVSSRSSWWVALLIVVSLAAGLYLTQARWMPIVVGHVITTGKPNAEIENNITEKQAQSVEPVNAAEQIEVATKEVPVAMVEPDVVETGGEDEQALETADNREAQALAPIAEVDSLAPTATPEVAVETEQPVEFASIDPSSTMDNNEWLNFHMEKSREWLGQANRDSVSIQVLMRRKSAMKELVNYLRTEWPLDLEQTYVYEVITESKSIYRVFYREFGSLAEGQREIARLPESVKVNQPYLQSIHRMQKALL